LNIKKTKGKMNQIFKWAYVVPFVFFIGCKSNTGNTTIDTAKHISAKADTIVRSNADLSPPIAVDTFEKAIYLKVDKILSGKLYTNADGKDCFYRVLQIPEEENIMLVAEHISIGEEDGNYKLLKRVHLTGPNTPLANYFFNSGDSLNFVDSVTVAAHVTNKVVAINLDKIK
jgi:hypothetical protein